MNTRKGTERVRGEKPKRERKRYTRDILQDGLKYAYFN